MSFIFSQIPRLGAKSLHIGLGESPMVDWSEIVDFSGLHDFLGQKKAIVQLVLRLPPYSLSW